MESALKAGSAQSHEITRQSKSNLAFAFATLPVDRRRDMTTFYAFCRVVDDIVDEPAPSEEDKRQRLDRWRQGLDKGFDNPSPLEEEVFALREKYQLPLDYFLLILEGMEMDLEKKRYATFEDLKYYCYRVASAVGLISLRIFGCVDPRSLIDYAENLGYALQLTNIIRDVAEDWRKDQRIYLPLEDLERFDLNERSIAEGHSDMPGFKDLMEFQYHRALEYYKKTQAYVPPQDRSRMVASDMMLDVYGRILKKMKRDGFRVFEKRYRLSALEKGCILTKRSALALLSRRSS